MQNTREQKIVRTSIVGVAVNVLLAIAKAAIGLISGSIAIVLDAVNNLSDALSSVITIIGTKLAGKEADKKHPFGYGRIEYLSAMVISLIVLYAGITSLTESVKQVIHPGIPDYSPAALIIVALAVVAKLLLGGYVKKQGKKLNSDALVNSGEDAMMDSIISASTLVAALLFVFTGLSLEAWLGAVISLFIVKSGLEMLGETLSHILGESADVNLAKSIKRIVLSYPEISGCYDLVLHNYGPDAYTGSLHVEVPDTCTADDLDELLRKISVRVYQECRVILTAIGVYSVNTKDPKAKAAREEVTTLAKSVPHVLEVHGFHLNEEAKHIRFDLMVGFGAKDRKATYKEALGKVQAAYPDYTLETTMDTDFTEEEE